MKTSMWQVVGKRFNAGLYMVNDRIDDAGPALSWVIGESRAWLHTVAQRSGWKLLEVDLVSVPEEYRR